MKVSQGDRSPYIFDDSVFAPGGKLYGDNILCRCFADGHLNIKLPHGKENDPDYLLYLWLYSKGESWTSQILQNEIASLYLIYSTNGFEFMLPFLKKREAEYGMLMYGSFYKMYTFVSNISIPYYHY